jgi:myo-inositol 2-dehydrogenase / D-chiro-inositol 1-dehydrogenase
MTVGAERVRLGVIGCGWVTERCHLPSLRRMPNIEAVALADIDAERLRRLGERFRVERRYRDYRALLDDPDIAAVAVCVPPELHAEVALAGLDAGKHLFIEKPLALSLEDCDRLLRHAGGSTRKIMVGFNLRWHRLARQARDIIEQGSLGAPKLVQMRFTSGSRWQRDLPEWKRRRDRGGGVFFEMAVHHFDLLRFLLQSEVREILAMSRSDIEDDRTVAVAARTSDGTLVVAGFSDGTSESNEVEIYGPNGALHLSCYRFDGLEIVPASTYAGNPRNRLRRVARLFKELPQALRTRLYGGDFAASYRAEWRHFADCIQRDAPVECTLEDGRRASELARAAIESAATGRSIAPRGER